MRVMKYLLCLLLIHASVSMAQSSQPCTINGAFYQGMLDAHNGTSQQNAYGDTNCSGTLLWKNTLTNAYVRGYKTPLPNDDKTCIQNSFSNVCGYGCIKNSFGDVKCGQYPGEQCLTDISGKIICGFDCKENSMRVVKCATTYLGQCTLSSDGQINCS